MKKILVLKSSILADNSQSNQLSQYLVSQLKDVQIIERDLGANPLPYFDGTAAVAVRGTASNEAQQQLLNLSNELVAEIQNADLIVINAPMYNLNIPAQLKSYFDFITRPQVTFRYTENGPEGLIKDKKAIVLATFGGIHKDQPTDIVTPYLKAILGFIGITDVQFVYAQGIGFGPEAIEKAQNQAKQEIKQLVANL